MIRASIGTSEVRPTPKRSFEARPVSPSPTSSADFFRKFSYDPHAIAEEDVAFYVDRLSGPGALRSAFAYYRTFALDAANNRENAREKLAMPVLALGAEYSMGEMVGHAMQQLADDVTSGVVRDSGHWIPEEQPEELVRLLGEFLA